MPTAARDPRGAVISALADAVTSLRVGHPTRVAVEGRGAAGKTTLADELAEVLRARGRECVRASIDDFHRPGHKWRSIRGEWTPRSYYEEAYDSTAFRDLLLWPLGPGGDRRCRTAIFDAFHDASLPEVWQAPGAEAVVVVDGIFLRKPEFAGCWEYGIWLDVDFETMVARARRRDVAWVGSETVVEQRYRRHWIPTHELYERLTDAPARADAVVDNRDLEHPRLLRLSRYARLPRYARSLGPSQRSTGQAVNLGPQIQAPAVQPVDLTPRLQAPAVRDLLAYAVGYPTPAKLDRVAQQYALTAARLVGFELDGALVGCLGYEPAGAGHAIIRHIVVAADARRHGIGRQMVDWLVATERLDRVTAETDRHGVGFYRRGGFQVTSLGERYPGVERFSCELAAGRST
jgi:uridine kinase